MSSAADRISALQSPLLQPVQINGLQLKNRLVVAPMTRVSAAPSGLVTDAMVRYYSRFASGEFGLVISEGTYTDQAFSQTYANQPGLSDVLQAKAWQAVTRSIHAAGGKVFVQLMHGGALSQANRFRDHTVGPSAIRPKGKQLSVYRGLGEYPIPKQISAAEIADAIGGFSRASILALEVAGFDGIEIHGANGYLLDQFLTDYTNQRQDRWGGSILNRMRLIVEVIRAIRERAGSTVPLGVRISQGKVNDSGYKMVRRGRRCSDYFRRRGRCRRRLHSCH
jgi:2,4-dienoyl-CoA reductase-like NADH-dependent reductase (Old Yellow Enzyme family)